MYDEEFNNVFKRWIKYSTDVRLDENSERFHDMIWNIIDSSAYTDDECGLMLTNILKDLSRKVDEKENSD
jgi:hypothetical protein